jgi:Flp pilus assembly protein TadD
MGTVRELLGRHSDATEDYSKALELKPGNVVVRNLRAWNYANQKKFELAQADFAESIRLAPKNPEAHLGVGYALAELGREDEARQEVSAALLVASDNQLVLHNIACIYGRLSAAGNTRRIEYENLALSARHRAVRLSNQNPIGPDADELALIHSESAFPQSLKSRPEFKKLIEHTNKVTDH